MRKVMISLAITSLLFVGCGGGGSSDSSPITETNSTTENATQEVEKVKLLNETIVGRWHVHLYNKNNLISDQLYYYDFQDDGKVIYGSPYVDKEYVLDWVIQSGKVKIIFTDFTLTLEPIDYYSEPNRIINMREVSSSGTTNILAWDKIGN